MTDDLQQLLVRGGLHGPYILVPESFGGLLALSLTQRIPDQVAGVVFVDSVEPQLWQTVMPGASTAWRFHDLWWDAAVRCGVVRAAFNTFSPAWVRALPKLQREQFRSVYARPSVGYSEGATAFAVTKPADIPLVLPGKLGSTPITVLVHRRQNAILGPAWEAGWPEAQKRLAALSSESRMVVVTGSSHMIAGENPSAVVDAVRAILRRPPKRKPLS